VIKILYPGLQQKIQDNRVDVMIDYVRTGNHNWMYYFIYCKYKPWNQ